MKKLFKLLILIIGTNFVFLYQQPALGQTMEKGNYLFLVAKNAEPNVGSVVLQTTGGKVSFSTGEAIFFGMLLVLMGACFCAAFFLTIAEKETKKVMARIENKFNLFRQARHMRNRIKNYFSYQPIKETETMGSE